MTRMTTHFHRNLNRMALFTALLAAGLIMFFHQFMLVAISNIYLNGIIIGTGLFGIGVCFVEMFKLLPEYRWLHEYITGKKNATLPPRLLRAVALMLRNHPNHVSPATTTGLLDMILVRIEDSRESIRYITNTLIFLGLLGTFWGLIMTVGGFAELISGLNFADDAVLERMQAGLSMPLAGMATAFTSSLMGLAASLIVGFLGLQVQLAQNAIFHELQEYLSAHTTLSDNTDAAHQITKTTRDLTNSVRELRQTVTEII